MNLFPNSRYDDILIIDEGSIKRGMQLDHMIE